MGQTTAPKALDDCHCKTLDECLRSCSVTQEMIEKAKAAGLDMSSAEEQNKLHASIASGLREQFFPQGVR